MTPTIACDVSYFQRPVNDSYPHRWLIFRSNDGTFRDPNFAANMRWARKRFAQGKLDGFIVYFVVRPGVDAARVHLDMAGAKSPAGMVSMGDVESWGGQIRGDHSSFITAQLQKCATYHRSRDRVLAYANGGDFANIYPHRPSWLRFVVASYGSQQPRMTRMVGWQYSDGQSRWPVPSGYPRSSAPFGRCDHNVFPGHTPKTLAHVLGLGPAATPRPELPKTRPQPAIKKPVAPAQPVVPKEIDMLLVKTTVDTPRGARAVYLTNGVGLSHVASVTDLKGLQARLGPPVPITEAQFAALGGRR